MYYITWKNFGRFISDLIFGRFLSHLGQKKLSEILGVRHIYRTV